MDFSAIILECCAVFMYGFWYFVLKRHTNEKTERTSVLLTTEIPKQSMFKSTFFFVASNTALLGSTTPGSCAVLVVVHGGALLSLSLGRQVSAIESLLVAEGVSQVIGWVDDEVTTTTSQEDIDIKVRSDSRDGLGEVGWGEVGLGWVGGLVDWLAGWVGVSW